MAINLVNMSGAISIRGVTQSIEDEMKPLDFSFHKRLAMGENKGILYNSQEVHTNSPSHGDFFFLILNN